MSFITETTWTELWLLLLAFGLSAVIGLEREIRQKAAGFRTHVLVGTGAAGFTLVSAYGFSAVIGDGSNTDPSRIAAQIVSGIGFLGAGVIFTRRDAVHGLTTAATIWLAAAVGMAAGAGMISLAVFLTVAHLLALVVIGPVVHRFPVLNTRRVLEVTYSDRRGILRELLRLSTDAGFSARILSSRTVPAEGSDLVTVDLLFRGTHALSELIDDFCEVEGVHEAKLVEGCEESD